MHLNHGGATASESHDGRDCSHQPTAALWNGAIRLLGHLNILGAPTLCLISCRLASLRSWRPCPYALPGVLCVISGMAPVRAYLVRGAPILLFIRNGNAAEEFKVLEAVVWQRNFKGNIFIGLFFCRPTAAIRCSVSFSALASRSLLLRSSTFVLLM